MYTPRGINIRKMEIYPDNENVILTFDFTDMNGDIIESLVQRSGISCEVPLLLDSNSKKSRIQKELITKYKEFSRLLVEMTMFKEPKPKNGK